MQKDRGQNEDQQEEVATGQILIQIRKHAVITGTPRNSLGKN